MQNLATGLTPKPAATTKPDDPPPLSLTSMPPIAGSLQFVAAKDDKDDDDDDDDDDKKKKKKDKDSDDARAALAGTDDNAGDQTDTGNPVARATRARERSRIAAIIESEAGKANLKAAFHLAFHTSMARDEAVGMLLAVGPATAPEPAPVQPDNSLRTRMAAVPQPVIGSVPQTGAASTDPFDVRGRPDAIVNALAKARGELPPVRPAI